MGRFLTQGELTPVPERGLILGYWPKFYRVTKEFRYQAANGQIIAVPLGFVSDGASTGLAWPFVPPWGPYQAGAIIHDYLIYLYRLGQPHPLGPNPEAIDKLFHTVMKDGGTYPLLRNVMYAAVRIGNWSARNA